MLEYETACTTKIRSVKKLLTLFIYSRTVFSCDCESAAYLLNLALYVGTFLRNHYTCLSRMIFDDFVGKFLFSRDSRKSRSNEKSKISSDRFLAVRKSTLEDWSHQRDSRYFKQRNVLKELRGRIDGSGQRITIYRGEEVREIREVPVSIGGCLGLRLIVALTRCRSRCSLCESLEHHGCVLGPCRSLEFAATSSRRRVSDRDKGKKE